MNGKTKSDWLGRVTGNGAPLGGIVLGGRFLAVDFDSLELRMVQVAPGLKGPSLRKFCAVEIPPDIDVKNPQLMGEFLAGAIRSKRFSRLPLVMNVPRSQAVLKPLQLPPGTGRDEIAGMVRFQVQGDIPFPPEEAVLDFTIESESRDASLDVLAAAVQTSTVEYYRNIAAGAGLKLLRLGLRSYANACCAEACSCLEHGQTTALVHVTADETEIDVLEGGNLVFSRSAAVKIQPASRADHDRREEVDEVVSEIIRTLQGYAAICPEGSVNRIFVAGGTGIEPEAVEMLEQLEQYHCSLFNPAESGRLRKKSRPDESGAMISAIGLAFGTRLGQKIPFDFLHPKQPIVKRDPKLARRNTTALAGLLAMIIFIVGGWLYLDGKAGEVTQLRQKKKIELKKRKNLERLVARVKKIDSWDERRIDWLNQWANISSVMPEAREVYIDDLQTATPSITLTKATSAGKTVQRKPKGCFRLTVRAHNSEDIAKLVQKLQDAGYIPETKKDGEDPRNPFGYVRHAKMTLYIPADMEIDVASLRKHKRPKNDDLTKPLKQAKKPAEAAQ